MQFCVITPLSEACYWTMRRVHMPDIQSVTIALQTTGGLGPALCYECAERLQLCEYPEGATSTCIQRDSTCKGWQC